MIGVLVMVLASTAVAVLAPTAPPSLPACVVEDGSGQAICVWDGQHMENGTGRSYVVVRRGSHLQDEAFVYITHQQAHRLLH